MLKETDMKNTRQLFVYRILKYVYGFDLVGEVASYSNGVVAVGGIFYQKPSKNCILQDNREVEVKKKFYVFFNKTKSGYSIKFKTIRDYVPEDQLETIKQRVAKICPEAEVDIYNNRHLRLRLPKLP